jgi:excisionase family DNA binding protein
MNTTTEIPKDRLLTKGEVATYLGVTTRTVENWQRLGMPHYKLGARCARFKIEDVDSFLREKCMVRRTRQDATRK